MLDVLNPLVHPWRFALALCLLAIARGIALMCIMPPGEGWDEYQHVAYVQEIAAGRGAPILNETRVDDAVIEAAVQLPMSASAAGQLKGRGALTYEQYWNLEPSPRPIGTGAVRLYQAQHAPLWYRMVAPVYQWTGGAANWRASVAALRLINLALLCGTLLCAVTTIRVLWPGGTLTTLAAVTVALSPMMLVNAARAANDALAMLLTTASVLCVALAVEKRAWWVLPAAGLAGLAFWAKTTSIALLPFGALAIALCMKGRWPMRLAMAGLFAAIFAALIAPYLIQSHATYGVLIPAQESVVVREQGARMADWLRAAGKVNWFDEVNSWWTKGTLWTGGWSFIRPAKLWRTLYALLLWGGAVAWIASVAVPRLRARAAQVTSWRVGMFCLLLVASFTAALAAHAVSSMLAWGVVKTNPWYASAAIPMLLLLVSGGYARALPARYAAIATSAIAAVYLIAELSGMLLRMPVRYTLISLWDGAATRLASMQPAMLGRYTLAGALAMELIILAAVVISLIRLREVDSAS